MTVSDPASEYKSDEYDHYCRTLIHKTARREGWQVELANYLTDAHNDIAKDPDLVEW